MVDEKQHTKELISKKSLWARVSDIRRTNWVLTLCLATIALLVLMALFGELLTPYSPYKVDLAERFTPPFWQDGGSWDHPLGTDSLGRDVLTRIVVGARVSLSVSALALTIAGLIGTAIGILAGYRGGMLDAFLMRVADATLAFPIILIALLLVLTLGPGYINVIIAIGIVLWARYARVIRGEVLSLKERDFVAQARVAGASSLRIMVRHLFPNVVNTLIVLLTLQVGWVIIAESALSFLGAGIPPPTAAWGSMVAAGREYLTSAWWVAVFPGLAILATVLSFNILGDWLRDRLDPKLRQV